LGCLFGHHQTNFFGAYDHIFLDYNFAPGESYQEERWQNFLTETILLIAQTNLLTSNGNIWLPDWTQVTDLAKSPKIQDWFDVEEVGQDKNPLVRATSILLQDDQNFRSDTFTTCPKFWKFKMKKRSSRSNAISLLKSTIKSIDQVPSVLEGFEMLRGQSAAFPLVLDPENDPPGPLLEYFRALRASINQTMQLNVIIDRAGNYYFEKTEHTEVERAKKTKRN
jgi:hypothetical protein